MSNTNQNNNGTANMNNVNTNAADRAQQGVQQPRQTFSEKHPKLVGFWKSLPGALLACGKKLLGGVIIIGGGIVAGELALNLFGKPKSYGTLPLMGNDSTNLPFEPSSIEMTPVEPSVSEPTPADFE